MYVDKFEKICDDLNKLSYDYIYKESLIEVNLGFGLLCEIQKKDNKIDIQGFLKPWNPITGVFRMELEKSLKLNSILLIFAFVVIFLIYIDGFPPTLFLFVLVQLTTIHIVAWYMYYIIKFYFFKHRIENIIFN